MLNGLSKGIPDMNKTHNYPMGSVSSGTMRSEDLYDAFTSALKDLDPKRYEAFTEDNQYAWGDDDDTSMDNAVKDLFDILNEYAAPYFYFGVHPSDGADYGFWFSEESFEDDCRYGTVHKCSELPDMEVTKACTWFNAEYIAVVSDHGNITLYDLNGEEVWSIV
jgi:hypothetical protein